jgi:predicted ArsR family transcriptional regulator
MTENTDTDTDTDTPGRNTKRAETGLYASQYSTDTIIETLEREDMVGTRDIADALGCVYDTAYKRLRKLEDEGRVESQKVANTRIWDLADDTDSDTDTETESGSESSMPTVEDGLTPDAVNEEVVSND